MALLPAKVIDGAVYDSDRNNMFLGIANVDNPNLENVTDELKGFGMSGETEVSLPIVKNMTFTIHFHTICEDSYSLFEPGKKQIEVRSALQVENTERKSGFEDPVPVRYIYRTKPRNLNLGKLDPGRSQDVDTELGLDVFIMYLNGKRVIEIDILNGKYQIGDKDYRAPINDALGIS